MWRGGVEGRWRGGGGEVDGEVKSFVGASVKSSVGASVAGSLSCLHYLGLGPPIPSLFRPLYSLST